MPKARANGIHIEYETFGDASGRPLLLIGGLASQLIHWDDDLCKMLSERGHFVIRFDNRDTGFSTKFDETGVPAFGDVLKGETKVPYTLEDMADDATALLKFLGIGKAHICGVSMGGTIAQIISIHHAPRLLSLISIYSTSGGKGFPPPRPEVLELLLAPSPKEREAHIEYMVSLFRAMAGRGFAFDEEWARMIASKAYDRSFSPEGTARQFLALMTQKKRKEALASLSVPSLIIQGDDDPLIPVEAGEELAGAIPGARLLIIKGMGHDLPHGGAWPEIVEAITTHTLRAAF